MEKKKKTKRMRELVELLNKARRAYEQENTEIMSNFEYDRLYDELLSLEKELETTLASRGGDLMEDGWSDDCSDL